MEERKNNDRYEKLINVEYPDPNNFNGLTIIKEFDNRKGTRTTMLNGTENIIINDLCIPKRLISEYELNLLKN